MPEAGGLVGDGEDHEQLMLALGLQSKREIARTRIRVRAAMATQTREQAATLAAARHTDTGSLTPARTRTRRTPHGAAARTGSSQTRPPRRWWRGCSSSGWPGAAPRGSPAH